MNSRQRVLAAIDHRETDRIPMDLGTTDTFVAREVYEGMASLLGLDPTAAQGVDHPGAFLTPDEKMLEILGIDVRLGYSVPPNPPDHEEVLPDGTLQWSYARGQILRRPAGFSDFQLHRPAVHGPLTSEEIDRVFPPEKKPSVWYDPAAALEKIQEFYNQGKAVQCQKIIMPVTGTSTGILSFESWALELARNPDLICRLMDRFLEYLYQETEPFYEVLGGMMDLTYGIGDDVASHTAMWMSPAHYRKYVKPRHAEIVQFIKARTRAKIIHHCCGSCREIIPDFIEIGVDILNPTQTSASGMNPFELKKDFGQDMTFWGGIDVIELLPRGTPADIEREVKRHIDALAPGGGYILAPSHIIQRYTPPENVITMYRVAREYGRK